ncbi:MAG: hypothetical protein ACLP9C_06850 [Acidimicrobiales bacterium]
MAYVWASPKLISVTWCTREDGDVATFQFANGPVSSHRMTLTSARQTAVQMFGDDCLFEERFDGGIRWSIAGFQGDDRAGQ